MLMALTTDDSIRVYQILENYQVLNNININNDNNNNTHTHIHTCIYIYIYIYIGSKQLSIEDIAKITSIKEDDVLSTMQHNDLLRYYKGNYVMYLSPKVMEAHERQKKKKIILIDPKCIRWKPIDWAKRGRW